MINRSNLCVIDFETVGETEDQAKNPNTAIPASIAAKMFQARTLEPFANGEFYSFFHVDPTINICQASLDFIHVERTTLTEAPNSKTVWNRFQDFVNQFNYEHNDFTAPILTGQNSRNYDSVIVDRLNAEYGKKGKDTVLFSKFRQIDLMDFTFAWFENAAVPKNNKLRTLLDFCNIKYNEDELHQANFDVKYTGILICKFLKLHRALYNKVNWNNNAGNVQV